jgi:tRNA threonylcarbamoyladenosine biosynthesis protein TsaE
MLTITCPDETDTRAAGARLAALLRPGDVIVLAGELGCGKTVFAGGVADGLGIERPVTSPSFVLVRTYDDGFLPLVHVDVYRLGSLAEFEDLEVLEFADTGVAVIEWGEAVVVELPEDHLVVRFDVHEDGSRTLRFEPHGVWNVRNLPEVLA